MVLNPDFREFIELLNEKEVDYLVIGGYAVAYHGHPRYTKDLDFWIWLNRENAEKVVDSINSFGFKSLGIVVEDLLDSDNIIQLGYPPARIDLLTDIPGVDFQECYTKREIAKMEGVNINFIDIDSLIRTKLAVGRPQDRADAAELTKKKKHK